MNAVRYVACGVISLTLHSVAMSYQAPQDTFSMEKAPQGQSVAIQLVAAAKSKPSATQPTETPPVTEPVEVVKTPEPEPTKAPPAEVVETAVEKKPEPSKKKPLAKPKDAVQPTPVKEPKKITQPQVTKVVKEAKAVKKEAIKKELVTKEVAKTTKREPTPKPIEKKPTETKDTTQQPSEEHAEKAPNQAQANADVSTQARDNAPILIEKPKFAVRPKAPSYPRIAKRKGMEGNVLLEIWLDEDGEQTKQLLIQSSGFDVLDKAALVAVKKWRFSAHRIDGVGQQHRVRIPVRFNLD